MKPIIIVGCGPAGLLAAHACTVAELPFRIYSRKIKSQMYGAMFLHKPILGVTDYEPDLHINIIKDGVQPGYAEKVYGDPSHQVSWARFKPGTIAAWSLSDAYDRLWDTYSNMIEDQEVTYWWMQDKRDNLVFNTVPKGLLCNKPLKHQFKFQDIWVKVERDSDLFDGNNVIIYNGWTPDGKYGKEGPNWYRYTQIQGDRSWEFAMDPGPDLIGDRELVRGYKPITNNCDCLPFVHHIGRFGKWRSGVLTHHAFEEAADVLAQV